MNTRRFYAKPSRRWVKLLSGCWNVFLCPIIQSTNNLWAINKGHRLNVFPPENLVCNNMNVSGHQVCHSKSGEINPVKVGNLVKAYVDKYKHARKHRKGEESVKAPEVQTEAVKTADSPWGGLNYRQGQSHPLQTLTRVKLRLTVSYAWPSSQTLWRSQFMIKIHCFRTEHFLKCRT